MENSLTNIYIFVMQIADKKTTTKNNNLSVWIAMNIYVYNITRVCF